MRQQILQYLANSDNYWEKPDGGFSSSGYPSKTGYAHEEWNFNTDDPVDGFIYGYMYRSPQKKYLKSLNGTYTIYFHSKHPKTKEWNFVGMYKNASFIDEVEREKIKKIWKKNGVIERRAQEILDSRTSKFKTIQAAKKHYLRDFALTVKVKKEDVFLFNPPVKLVPSLIKRYLMNAGSIATRYSTYTYLKSEIPLDFKKIREGKKAAEKIEEKYIRTNKAQIIEVTKKHKILLGKISTWFQNKGYRILKEDQGYIDLLVEKNSAKTLIELKIVIDKKTKYSIREALGQILEYDHKENKSTKSDLLIILDKKPTENDYVFIDSVKSKFSVPLRLSHFENRNLVSKKDF